MFNIKDPRFRLKLDEYEYDINYKKGDNNTNVEALSRIGKVTNRSEHKAITMEISKISETSKTLETSKTTENSETSENLRMRQKLTLPNDYQHHTKPLFFC